MIRLRAVEAGAESLRTFRDWVDTARTGEPALLAVLTATGRYADRRDDGIRVVPIRSLGP